MEHEFCQLMYHDRIIQHLEACAMAGALSEDVCRQDTSTRREMADQQCNVP